MQPHRRIILTHKIFALQVLKVKMNTLAGLAFVKQIREMVVVGADAKKVVAVVYAKALGQDITDLKSKQVHVVFPPAEKNDRPTAFQLSLVDNVELRDFVNIHRGNFMDRTGNIKIRFQQLENDGVYTLFGPSFMALENDVRTAKVNKKMQEISSLVAVKKELEGKSALHLNVTIYGNHNNEILVENIVKDEKSEASRAYICDFAKVPSADDVRVLQEKADKFAFLAKHHEPFQSVTQVIPVLAGRSWHPEVESKARVGLMWRVHCGPGKLQVIRSYTTTARRLLKHV